MRRRAFFASPLLLVAAGIDAVDYAPVLPKAALAFPRDHGAHLAFRTEWWYVTGWLRDRDGREFGMQVTFFRNRPGVAEAGSSAFAPRQLVFAHAALADARRGALLHDQRAARAGLGLAGTAEDSTRAWIDDWSLAQDGDAYVARIVARDFAFDLRFSPTQPIMLQGDAGFSRKGPGAGEASYYYSRPQLTVTGTLSVGQTTKAVSGTAWLDHEWSSEMLAANAVGWDWTGINRAGGGALMAFAIRGRDGVPVWAGGAARDADGRTRVLAPADVRFVARRRWRSPRTGVEYPVEMALSAGGDDFVLAPLFDDQELDSRASTGTLYWEGAVRALASSVEVGRGYLELTGYGAPIRLQ